MSPAKTREEAPPEEANQFLARHLDADFGMVTLVAGNTSLVVHKAVLASGSPVLAAMLDDLPEDDDDPRLTITDIDGPVLRKLVTYLYCLRVPPLGGLGPELLAAAHRYGMVGLRTACEQILAMENAAD